MKSPPASEIVPARLARPVGRRPSRFQPGLDVASRPMANAMSRPVARRSALAMKSFCGSAHTTVSTPPLADGQRMMRHRGNPSNALGKGSSAGKASASTSGHIRLARQDPRHIQVGDHTQPDQHRSQQPPISALSRQGRSRSRRRACRRQPASRRAWGEAFARRGKESVLSWV